VRRPIRLLLLLLFCIDDSNRIFISSLVRTRVRGLMYYVDRRFNKLVDPARRRLSIFVQYNVVVYRTPIISQPEASNVMLLMIYAAAA